LLSPDRAVLVLLHGLRWGAALQYVMGAARPDLDIVGDREGSAGEEWATQLSLLAIHASLILPPQVRAWSASHTGSPLILQDVKVTKI